MKFIANHTLVAFVSAFLLCMTSCTSPGGSDAYEYQCGSNIRQLAIACHTFALENDGKLPEQVQQLSDYLPSYWGGEGFGTRADLQGPEIAGGGLSAEHNRDVKIDIIKKITGDQSVQDSPGRLFVSEKNGTYMMFDGNLDITEYGALDTTGHRLLPYGAQFYGKEGYKYVVQYYHVYWDEKPQTWVRGQDISVATVTRFHSLGFQEILWVCDAQGRNSLEGRIAIDFVTGAREICDKTGEQTLILDRMGKVVESSHKMPSWWNPNAAMMLKRAPGRKFNRLACPSAKEQKSLGYEIVAKGSIHNIKNPASTVLIREKLNAHRGKHWVAFVDGHIELRKE